jgi:MFS family permease
MLPIAQQVSGQSLILWYGPQIYNSIGLNVQRAALVQNGVLFGSTILCLFLIDRIGRRALMLLGTIGCMSMMLGLSIIFFLTAQHPAQHNLADAIWAMIIVYEFFYANSWVGTCIHTPRI